MKVVTLFNKNNYIANINIYECENCGAKVKYFKDLMGIYEPPK